MSDLRKAAEMALEVMEYNRANGTPNMGAAIEALRQALAEPEQEPVAWLEPEWQEKICPEVGYEVTITDDHPRDLCWIPLYTAPPKREWVGLTDEEINWICFSCFSPKSNAHKKSKHFYEQLEAKLKEKNT